MALAFNGTTPNLNYAVNRLNKLHSKSSSLIGGLIHGSGTTASNEKVEAAVQWAINKANSNYITYSTLQRNLKNPNGNSYDCSSFIITAFYAAGVDINASYTGNMRDGFTAAGWRWIPGSYFAATECQRGDILLNEVNHTQMYIGDNQDVNCGSTPAQVEIHSPNYGGAGWDGILRYDG